MKDFLHVVVPPLEIDRELQKAFCTASTKCVEGDCKECIYSSENLELFKKRFNELEK